MEKENAIIIDGIKHISKSNDGLISPCDKCSLLHLCVMKGYTLDTGPCNLFEDTWVHFETLEEE